MSQSSYHLILVRLRPEDLEIVQGVLYDEACVGLEEVTAQDEVVLKSYFDGKTPLEPLIGRLKARLPFARSFSAETFGLSDMPWKPHDYEPFVWVEVGRGSDQPDDAEKIYWITPPAYAGRHFYEIIIQPARAFGTGRHETTRLVAETFLNLPRPRSLLDLGCGSGILALLAKKEGVAHVVGVEISDEALKGAAENCRLSGCDDIALYSQIEDVTHSFDMILANILTPTLMHLKDAISRRLAPGGLLICSGITEEEGLKIEARYADMKLFRKMQRDEWLCYVFRKE